MDKYLKRKEENEPRVYKINSFVQFVEVATWLYSDGNVIFRGQKNDCLLIPSVGRNNKRSQVLWREKEILEEFKRESIPYLNFLPKNNWQWLAVAQHNGLPTRLLDWTKNPLVALWFAVENPAKDEKPGVVWAFNYQEEDSIFNTEEFEKDDLRNSPFSIDKTYVYFPEHVYPFIQAQLGVFTVHHRDGQNPRKFPPLEEIEYADSLLTKIEIPADLFATARYELFRVGISPSSLFPGLSGIVQKIRYDNIMLDDEGEIQP